VVSQGLGRGAGGRRPVTPADEPADGDRANACSVSRRSLRRQPCQVRGGSGAEEANVATCPGLRSVRQFRPAARTAGAPIRSLRSCVQRPAPTAAFTRPLRPWFIVAAGRTAAAAAGRRLGPALMPRLLLVHHTPSPALQAMLEAAVSGARTDEIDGVEVVIRPTLTAAAADVLAADGYLLSTPANIGYMSGALKHFFDGIYYPCLEAPGAGPTACTCTATWTPAARYARSSRSPPACNGTLSGRPPGHRSARQARPPGLLGTRRTTRGRDRRMTVTVTPEPLAGHRPPGIDPRASGRPSRSATNP
jgi:hypothetical protein